MSCVTEKLVLAVPSKGRLQENAYHFFSRAGLDVVQARGARDYRGHLSQLPQVEVAFLSASEIVGQLLAGHVHLGVTGEDLLRESLQPEQKLELLCPLGFGYANVVVAVPQAWIDVHSMADLEDVASSFRARHGKHLRVATKYVRQTRNAFARHGIQDYRIVESQGATEGAPAAGQAEVVVDITTSGATLQANGLKVLQDGVLLRSQANLVASLAASWSALIRETARAILARILAEELARTTREVSAYGLQADSVLTTQASLRFDALPLENEHPSALTFSVAHNKAAELADWLLGNGGRRVTVKSFEGVFQAQNALYLKLLSRLDK